MDDYILHIEDIHKSFGDTHVLKGIGLHIRRGEFVTLLGASGCGKTTLLRIIAGLETPDSGRVLLEREDVTGYPPNKRSVNTVFQSYALFPHMSIAANIGYSLKLKGLSKKEISRQVEEALAMVQLSGFGSRKPSELSGGQRQRIAIARTLVAQPKVLLLDEPLGALDLRLRQQMQVELKRLQKKLGLTFIYITHDQEEALNMSDTIAVMCNGRFEQIGTPEEVYNHPKTSYVARFVGNANIIEGEVISSQKDYVFFRTSGGTCMAKCDGREFSAGEKIAAAVRSEHLALSPRSTDTKVPEPGISALVKEKSFTGGMLRIYLELPDGSELVASRHGIDSELGPGDRVTAFFTPESAVIVELNDCADSPSESTAPHGGDSHG